MRYVIMFGVLILGAAMAQPSSPAFAGGTSYDIRNDRGQHTATVRPDDNGNFDIIDRNGRRTETLVPNGDGSYDRRDLNGRRTGTIKPSGEPERDQEEGGNDD